MSRIYTRDDIPELLAEIQEAEQRSKIIMEEYGRNEKAYCNDSAGRNARRLKTAVDFLENGVSFKFMNDGIITINNYFHVSLSSNKWRVRHKNTWYRYSNPKQFVDKYVYKDKQNETV